MSIGSSWGKAVVIESLWPGVGDWCTFFSVGKTTKNQFTVSAACASTIKIIMDYALILTDYTSGKWYMVVTATAAYLAKDNIRQSLN